MELSNFWIDRLDRVTRGNRRQPFVAKDPNRLMGAKHALIDDPETPWPVTRDPRALGP